MQDDQFSHFRQFRLTTQHQFLKSFSGTFKLRYGVATEADSGTCVVQ